MSNPPLRVAVVGACPYPAPQGSQVYLRECAQALALAGADPRLVVYGYGGDGDPGNLPIHRAANPTGARKIDAGPSLSKPILDAALLRTLRRVIRDHAIDIVDAHNYEGLLVALASGFRPIVYHPHNAMADELPHYTRFTSAAARFGAWLDTTFPRRADAIIAPHQPLANYLATCGCDPTRIHVVPPPMPVPPSRPHRTYTDTPTILYTGNLDAYQNLDLLRAAAKLLRKSLPNIEVLVATPSQQKLHWARTIPTPTRNALHDLLHSDTILVCPRTSWSGFPIKLLNAMAAGATIVCCASAAHPIQNRITGIVVSDDDPQAMADALLALTQDPNQRKRLGDQALKTFTSTHNPNQVGATLLEIYRNLQPPKKPSS